MTHYPSPWTEVQCIFPYLHPGKRVDNCYVRQTRRNIACSTYRATYLGARLIGVRDFSPLCRNRSPHQQSWRADTRYVSYDFRRVDHYCFFFYRLLFQNSSLMFFTSLDNYNCRVLWSDGFSLWTNFRNWSELMDPIIGRHLQVWWIAKITRFSSLRPRT